MMPKAFGSTLAEYGCLGESLLATVSVLWQTGFTTNAVLLLAVVVLFLFRFEAVLSGSSRGFPYLTLVIFQTWVHFARFQ